MTAYGVKGFSEDSWLEKKGGDGIKFRLWLTMHETDKTKVFCSICPWAKPFCIKKNKRCIYKHCRGARHKRGVEELKKTFNLDEVCIYEI